MSSSHPSVALALTLVIPWLAAACAPSIQPTPQPTVAPTAQPTPRLSPGPTTPPQPSATLAAQSDLDNLLAQLEATHPDPWHGISRDEWVAALGDLKERLPGLTPEQAYADLCRLVASLSDEGRDGHQFVILPDDQERPALPFRTYEFAEGVFVTAAMPGYEELVGRRIEAIAGIQIDDVLAALEPLVPRDGPATVPGFRTIFLLRTSVLRGLGLVGDGAISILVAGDGQPEEVVEVIPADWADWRVWAGEYGIALPARDDTLYLSDPDTTLWWRTLPESHTLYVRYQRVQFVDSADASAIAAAAADPEVTSVVFDLRQNPGGDNHSIAPLLSVLRDATVNQPGRLYVLTDRLTFSAAANFATQLEQTTDAVFAGEQIGGGLNFWDDVRWVDLPHYPLAPRVGVSTRYWQFAAPDDPRLTIEPDILVHVSASDYFAGRDPVMEAVTAQ
jgi:hypothetical protein